MQKVKYLGFIMCSLTVSLILPRTFLNLSFATWVNMVMILRYCMKTVKSYIISVALFVSAVFKEAQNKGVSGQLMALAHVRRS